MARQCMRILLVGGLLALGVMSMLGCRSSNPDGSGAQVVSKVPSNPADTSETDTVADQDATVEEQSSDTAASSGSAGTRENPLPVGETALVGDWEVTIIESILDADAAMANESEFNATPTDGSQYVLIRVRATYVGEDSGDFYMDTAFKYYGSQGNTFDSSDAVAPDDLFSAGETFPGAEVEGNLIFEVVSEQVAGGALILEELISFEDSRVFFAVDD